MKANIIRSKNRLYQVPPCPSGLLWKFIFYENWFDGYYIGLDAIEMYDVEGKLLDITACGGVVSAVPFSLQGEMSVHFMFMCIVVKV
jgi:hypothetical protein